MKTRVKLFALIIGMLVFSLFAIGSDEEGTSGANSSNAEQIEHSGDSADSDMNKNVEQTEKAMDASVSNQAMTYTVTAQSVNIREGIGTSYDIIYTAKTGESFSMTGNSGQSESGATWIEVILSDDQIGWCSSNYGIVNSEVSNTNEDADSNTRGENQNITEDSMPLLKGTSLTTVLNEAEKYGVIEKYDVDFGYGTRCRSFEDASGGLMMDVIYSISTKEVLSADITTFNLISAEEQNGFIVGMAPVLCPPSDSIDVTTWVRDNIGKQQSTIINGTTYEVDLGPVGNLLYRAGNEEWENWDFKHQN